MAQGGMGPCRRPLAGPLAPLSLLLLATRAAGKGCFLPHVEVTMADGTAKPLAAVAEGDMVLSWDEAAGRPASSRVRAVPSFRRRAEEVAELALPHASLHATLDHPLWSRSRGGLVSLDPNSTLAEYGLTAALLQSGDVLEGHDGAAIPVQLRSRRLRPAEAALEVATLCLEPHHWFYAAGVRVHNKGCFPKTARVSLPGGGQRELQGLRPGDEVLSWDEAKRRSAVSTVVAPRTFVRDASEMRELRLPHGALRVTKDHPFWSARLGGLVSFDPAHTAREYGLPASSLLARGEVLEGERLQEVPVLAATNGTELLSRRLTAAGMGPQSEVDSEVEVMTLCLQPHHWFYVEGVRVHNKGCFAPWVRVLLGNGSQVAIADVKAGDEVLSWDGTRSLGARVLAVDSFPASELFRMEVRNDTGSLAGERQLSRQGEGSLVFTADHPIYSARAQGPVSLRPEQTLAGYGLAAGQMLRAGELVRRHDGANVPAGVVAPYVGPLPPRVLTLRLAGSHWFYAEGVLVHNKGGGYGDDFTETRRDFGSSLAFAAFVVSHSRRRRNTWISGGGCDFAAENASAGSAAVDGGGVPLVVRQQCALAMGSGPGALQACQRCDECKKEACVSSQPGCAQFLAGLYADCEDNNIWWILFRLTPFLVCCVPCLPCVRPKKVQTRAAARQKLEKEACNGRGLGSTAWSGFYHENGGSKPTTYQWTADANGRFQGRALDDDGPAGVKGIIAWPADADVGRIAWREEWQNGGNVLEAAGSIRVERQVLKIDAAYDSSKGVSGKVSLQRSDAPGQVAVVQQAMPVAMPAGALPPGALIDMPVVQAQPTGVCYVAQPMGYAAQPMGYAPAPTGWVQQQEQRPLLG